MDTTRILLGGWRNSVQNLMAALVFGGAILSCNNDVVAQGNADGTLIEGTITQEGSGKLETNRFSAVLRGEQYKISLKSLAGEILCEASGDGVDSFSVFSGTSYALNGQNLQRVVAVQGLFPWGASDALQVVWLGLASKDMLARATNTYTGTNSIALTHWTLEKHLPVSDLRIELSDRGPAGGAPSDISIYAPNYILMEPDVVKEKLPQLLNSLPVTAAGLVKMPLAPPATNGYLLARLSSTFASDEAHVPHSFSFVRFPGAPKESTPVLPIRAYRVSVERVATSDEKISFTCPGGSMVEDYRFHGPYSRPVQYLGNNGWLRRDSDAFTKQSLKHRSKEGTAEVKPRIPTWLTVSTFSIFALIPLGLFLGRRSKVQESAKKGTYEERTV